MFKAYSGIFWRRILLFCLLKGVLGNRWDPLPEDVRSVVSSNHLGEGTPVVFAEYHALLPDFRGDYGVKSELVEAATQEPVYKGSNTFLLPLYIPQGAIPLGVNERSTRSGKADSLPNLRIVRGGPLPSLVSDDSNINRSVTRRILLTGRRPQTETRSHPTPPPSFVRSWIKREPDSAESQDYVEEAKRSKQRVLTQRRLEGTTKAETNQSTTTSETIITETRKQNDSGNKEATRIKKITTRLENQPTKLNNTESIPTSSTSVVEETTASSNTDFKKITTTESPSVAIVTEDTKVNSEAQNLSLFRVEETVAKTDSPSKTNISETLSTESREILKLPLGRTNNNITTESSTIAPSTTEPSSTSRAATTASQINSNRGRNATSAFSKQHRQQVENINSRIRIKPVLPSSASTKIKAVNEKPLTSSTQSPTTPATTGSSSDITSESTQRSASKSPHKSPSWLLRRRATLMKEMNLRKEKQKTQDQKEEEIIEEIIEETESIIDRVLNSASQSSKHNLHTSQSDNKSNDIISPDDITSIDLLTDNEKPTKLVTTTPLSTSQSATSTSSTTELLMARQRVPIRTRRPIVSNPLVSSTTPLSYFLLNDDKNLLTSKFDFEDVKTIESESTNAITTSTPKVSLQNFLSQTPKDLDQFLSDITYQSPKSFSPPTRKVFPERPHLALVPKMKSPQDIVLEKLSELMKNATEGKKDSLHDIALDIEKLNEELASMGIHIIDAEFDGHKIRLKDQLKSNSTGTNFSGATTIRYLIPNTKSKSKPKKEPLSESFINHNLEVGIPLNTSDISRGNHFNRAVNGTVNNRPTERTFFTLTRSDNPPNRKVSTSNDNPSLIKNVYFNSESITDFPVTIQSFPEATRSNMTGGISVTIAEETTLEPISITDNLSSKIPLESKYVYDTSLDVSPENLNPTSHLRPSSSSSDIISITKLPPVTTTNSTAIDVSSNVTKGATYPNTFDDNSNNPLIMLVSGVGNMQDTKLPMDELEDSGSYIYFIGLLGIIPCIAAIAFLYRQRYKKEMKSLPQREERAEVFTPPINHPPRPVGHNDTLDAFPGYIFQESEARESPWELPRSKLRITSVIGEGHFGMVWKAEARHLCDWEEDGGPTVLVAVKGVKEAAGTKEKSDLLREMAIMQLLGQHNNVVTLLGCCTKQEPYYLIMEFVMFGKLLEFLRDQRSKNNYFNFSSDSEHLTSRDLTKFAFQIATGCEYMQSRGVIHRDLAARNILLDHNKICKIADFGLARSVKDMDNDIYEQKSKGPLPIRWMAPESLYMNIFTHKSDVWSFGILCWEIVTLGSTPYPGISAREVMRRVREGYRLERPEHCRSEFYKIVSKCWHQDINKRSSFATVKGELRELLDNPSGWVDLENFQEATYYSMHQNNEEKL